MVCSGYYEPITRIENLLAFSSLIKAMPTTFLNLRNHKSKIKLKFKNYKNNNYFDCIAVPLNSINTVSNKSL